MQWLPDPRQVFVVLEVVAVLAFALSGLVVAQTHRLDGVGTFIAAFLAAFGGGTLRDLLLDRRPFYWVEHQGMLWAVLLLSALASVALRLSSGRRSQRLMLVADAVGLGIFSATGTAMALQQGWSPLPCVLIGVLAATFGGLLRDVACHERPLLLADPTPYASVAFAGNWLLLALWGRAWADPFWVTAGVAALIAASRVLLAVCGVKLPQLDGGDRAPWR